LGNNLQNKSSNFSILATPEATIYNKKVSTNLNKGFVAAKIQICTEYENKRDCSSYPKISNYTFKGTVSDWGFFINRCANFDHVNNFADITLALQTLAALPSMGVVKTIGAEIAVGYVGKPIYPENIDQRSLAKASEMVYYLLKDNGTQRTIHSRYLLALQRLLEACSHSFDKEYVHREQKQCMGSCHSLKPNSKRIQKPKVPKRTVENQEKLINEIQEYLDTKTAVEQ